MDPDPERDTHDPEADTQVVPDPERDTQESNVGKIVFGSRPASSHIEFWVRDYGPGIAKDQMQKIFKLFYRVENELTRETVGTGIGLALVAQLVEQMNGTIDVVNCEPGAEFRIRLRKSNT